MAKTVNCHFSPVQPRFSASLGPTVESTNTTMERFIPNPKLKLKEQMREVMRFNHLSARTKQTPWDWTMRPRAELAAEAAALPFQLHRSG
ncbi:MAG TPA: hypothetical protein VFW05_01175 [Verrucomicrobiae bacterium]|nr:hypothetical protein [Verrucomicrobiae bacterium]